MPELDEGWLAAAATVAAEYAPLASTRSCALLSADCTVTFAAASSVISTPVQSELGVSPITSPAIDPLNVIAVLLPATPEAGVKLGVLVTVSSTDPTTVKLSKFEPQL
jgi:hypothetical protein